MTCTVDDIKGLNNRLGGFTRPGLQLSCRPEQGHWRSRHDNGENACVGSRRVPGSTGELMK